MAAGLFKAPTSNFWSSTLNGGIDDSVDTITLNSTSGLQSPGYVVIDREDGNGTVTPNSREVVKYTGISGSDLTGCTRGADNSTARSHSDGALVEATFTIGMHNDQRDAINAEHDTDGTHTIISAATVTTLDAGTLNAANSFLAGATVTSGAGFDTWSSSTQPTCSLTKSGTQAVTAGNHTAITFDGETFDTASMHDNSTNPSRITIPSGQGGYYLTGLTFNTSASHNVRTIFRTQIDGGSARELVDETINLGNDGSYTITDFRNISAGSYLEWTFWYASGTIGIASGTVAWAVKLF